MDPARLLGHTLQTRRRYQLDRGSVLYRSGRIFSEACLRSSKPREWRSGVWYLAAAHHEPISEDSTSIRSSDYPRALVRPELKPHDFDFNPLGAPMIVIERHVR